MSKHLEFTTLSQEFRVVKGSAKGENKEWHVGLSERSDYCAMTLSNEQAVKLAKFILENQE